MQLNIGENLMPYDPQSMTKVTPEDLTKALAGTRLQAQTADKRTVEVNFSADNQVDEQGRDNPQGDQVGETA